MKPHSRALIACSLVATVTTLAFLPTLKHLPYDDDLVQARNADFIAQTRGTASLLTAWTIPYEQSEPFDVNIEGRAPSAVDAPPPAYDSRRFRPLMLTFMHTLTRITPDRFPVWRGICLLMSIFTSIAVLLALHAWSRNLPLATLGAVAYSFAFVRLETMHHVNIAGGMFAGFSALSFACYFASRELTSRPHRLAACILSCASLFTALLFHDAAVHLVPMILALEGVRVLIRRIWKLSWMAPLALVCTFGVYYLIRTLTRPSGGEVIHLPGSALALAKTLVLLGNRFLYLFFHDWFNVVAAVKVSPAAIVAVGAVVLAGAGWVLIKSIRWLRSSSPIETVAGEAFFLGIAGILIESVDPNILSGRTYALGMVAVQLFLACLFFGGIAKIWASGPRVGNVLPVLGVLFLWGHGSWTTRIALHNYSRHDADLHRVVKAIQDHLTRSDPPDVVHVLNLCGHVSDCAWPTYTVGTFEEILRRKLGWRRTQFLLHRIAGSCPPGGACSAASVETANGAEKVILSNFDPSFASELRKGDLTSPVLSLLPMDNPYYTLRSGPAVSSDGESRPTVEVDFGASPLRQIVLYFGAEGSIRALSPLQGGPE